MNKTLIKDILIVNEGNKFKGNIIIEDKFIKNIIVENCKIEENNFDVVIDGNDKIVIPGVIDTHVHFREPGLVYKGNISSESKAAIAGGVTSFLEMPNTIPPTISMKEIENKQNIAKNNSYANYSFYIGATNDNLNEILNLDLSIVPGIKIFLGSSTGNLKLTNTEILNKLFSLKNVNLCIHSEDDDIIAKNICYYKKNYNDELKPYMHMFIRSEEACLSSTKKVIDLAKKYHSRVHLLHISSGKEVELIEKEKLNNNITAEACIPHIWFSDKDYEILGNKIKCNPSIKTKEDRIKIIEGLKNRIIDTIATDHAPHTIEEKEKPYLEAPSGIPSIQFSLLIMLELVHDKIFSIEEVVEKMAHNPAKLFRIKGRGYIRKGNYADLVILNLNKNFKLKKDNILSLCKWSPFEGFNFRSCIEMVIVNGKIIYNNGIFSDKIYSLPLEFY